MNNDQHSNQIIKATKNGIEFYVSYYSGLGSEWTEDKTQARKFRLDKATVVSKKLNLSGLVNEVVAL